MNKHAAWSSPRSWPATEAHALRHGVHVVVVGGPAGIGLICNVTTLQDGSTGSRDSARRFEQAREEAKLYNTTAIR